MTNDDPDTATIRGLARLEGKIDQFTMDTNRRITALEELKINQGSRTTAIISVCIAGVALAYAIISSIK